MTLRSGPDRGARVGKTCGLPPCPKGRTVCPVAVSPSSLTRLHPDAGLWTVAVKQPDGPLSPPVSPEWTLLRSSTSVAAEVEVWFDDHCKAPTPRSSVAPMAGSLQCMTALWGGGPGLVDTAERVPLPIVRSGRESAQCCPRAHEGERGLRSRLGAVCVIEGGDR